MSALLYFFVFLIFIGDSPGVNFFVWPNLLFWVQGRGSKLVPQPKKSRMVKNGQKDQGKGAWKKLRNRRWKNLQMPARHPPTQFFPYMAKKFHERDTTHPPFFPILNFFHPAWWYPPTFCIFSLLKNIANPNICITSRFFCTFISNITLDRNQV